MSRTRYNPNKRTPLKYFKSHPYISSLLALSLFIFFILFAVIIKPVDHDKSIYLESMDYNTNQPIQEQAVKSDPSILNNEPTKQDIKQPEQDELVTNIPPAAEEPKTKQEPIRIIPTYMITPGEDSDTLEPKSNTTPSTDTDYTPANTPKESSILYTITSIDSEGFEAQGEQPEQYFSAMFSSVTNNLSNPQVGDQVKITFDNETSEVVYVEAM